MTVEQSSSLHDARRTANTNSVGAVQGVLKQNTTRVLIKATDNYFLFCGECAFYLFYVVPPQKAGKRE